MSSSEGSSAGSGVQGDPGNDPITQLSSDLSSVSLQMGGSREKDEKPSLSKYFDTSSKSDSFFDQLSNVASDKNSAMMTSIRESPSNPELLSISSPTQPAVCTVFSGDGPAMGAQPAMAFEPLLFPTPAIGEGSGTIPVPSDFSSSAAVTHPPVTLEADPFTPGTDADRRRNAWIPSEETRRILVLSATSPPGSFTPDPEMLTKPGVVLEEDMVDNVHEVVQHYLGEAEAAKRKVLTAADVTQDDRGLRELIQAGCQRAAVNLTGRLLTMYGQGAGRAGHPTKHTPHSIQLWFTRIALLVKLRSFSLADVESEPFADLDRPDLYFQYYPDMHGSRQGTMVPFAFRLLLAELPQYLNKGKEAMARLHAVLAVIRKIVSNLEKGLGEDGSPVNLSESDRSESLKLWNSRETRTLYSIANCAVYQKDFEIAVNVTEMLMAREPERQAELRSALGRLMLMLGDMQAADKHLAPADPKDLRGFIDRGLAAVAQNAFQEAHDLFAKALELEPSNVLVINNMAVCLLYMGRLRDALKILEGALQANPSVALHESVLLNICTLYELESSFCLEQKLEILKLLAKHKGDGIYMGCLKLQYPCNPAANQKLLKPKFPLRQAVAS